jgi:monofunctional glycosyltransferase
LDITPEARLVQEAAAMDASPAVPEKRAETPMRKRLKTILKWVIGIALLPFALMLVYKIEFIHPVSTLMLYDVSTLKGYDRQWVEFEDISPFLVQSVMMSEDGQFCAHNGVDWVQMNGVISDALEGESTRGASTIPMQTAKNLFLWNGRSFVRKGLELPLALGTDLVLSKKRLMEIYLNIVEWGPGVYGIEAAAQYHFKVPASKLTRRQAALLAAARHPDRASGQGFRRLHQMPL